MKPIRVEYTRGNCGQNHRSWDNKYFDYIGWAKVWSWFFVRWHTWGECHIHVDLTPRVEFLNKSDEEYLLEQIEEIVKKRKNFNEECDAELANLHAALRFFR